MREKYNHRTWQYIKNLDLVDLVIEKRFPVACGFLKFWNSSMCEILKSFFGIENIMND